MRRSRRSFSLPIDHLRPATRVLLLAAPTCAIYSRSIGPLLFALCVLLAPWRTQPLPWRLTAVWFSLSAAAACTALLVSSAFFSPLTTLDSLRLGGIIFVCFLTFQRRNAVSEADVLHLAGRLGGQRGVVVPALSFLRILDLLVPVGGEIVCGARGRRLDESDDGSRLGRGLRFMTYLLITFFGAVVRYISEIGLQIDLRFGPDERIVVLQEGRLAIWDWGIVVAAFALAFWCYSSHLDWLWK